MFSHTPVVSEIDYHGSRLRLETGFLATQAHGSVLASLGSTTVLAAVVVGKKVDTDFFPLQVVYEERLYASGKIKGSRFIKREGRPSDSAILTGRMIDRSLRSLFDKHIRQEIQVVVTVLSLDETHPPDTLSVLAASAAVGLCKLVSNQTTPKSVFTGPVSATRVGMWLSSPAKELLPELESRMETAQTFEEVVDFLKQLSQLIDDSNAADGESLKQAFATVGRKNPVWAAKFRELYKNSTRLDLEAREAMYPDMQQFAVSPSYAQQQSSQLDLVVAGTRESITMIEAGANIVSESALSRALDKASEDLRLLTDFQNDFLQQAQNLSKASSTPVWLELPSPEAVEFWSARENQIEDCLYQSQSKQDREQGLQKLLQDSIELLAKDDSGVSRENLDEQSLRIAFDESVDKIIKKNILLKNRRLDGRDLQTTRQITTEVGVLPRTHGSSVFQRGQTQVLNVLTLGTMRDAQILDDMEDFDEQTKRYIHHYNFPAYSVGEVGRYTGPGRREIGHGALAEKALLPVLPSEEEFPYTMRLVSECLGSNGSTSMASTCASCLSLLDGGVPIKDLVAGVAMGLVLDSSSGQFKVLTDILGAEDHHGDMDFKVTGTAVGITALQLDNKAAGLTPDIIKQALKQAKEARMHILGIMRQTIDTPRTELSKHAPRVLVLNIAPEKIGEVIGPSGKIIKQIIQKFEVEIDIEDVTGKTFIYGKDNQKAEAARDYITKLTKEYKPGDLVQAQVFRIEAYGAFAKIDGTDKEGLIHISELANRRIAKVQDVIQMDEIVQAQVLEINDRGQISLSVKRAQP